MKKRKLLVVVLLLMCPFCLGWTSTYTKKVSFGGQTTITTNDPNFIREQQRQEEIGTALQEAPRRRRGDPIHVVFVNADTRQEREGNLQRLHQALLDHFKHDHVLVVSSEDLPPKYGTAMSPDYKLYNLIDRAKARGIFADVYVVALPGSEETAGIDRKTGKIGPMTAFKYSAVISSGYEYDEHAVSALGSIFRNDEVVEELAGKIKRVIKQEIAPGLPAPEAVRNVTMETDLNWIRQKTGIQPEDDVKTMFKKILNRQ